MSYSNFKGQNKNVMFFRIIFQFKTKSKEKMCACFDTYFSTENSVTDSACAQDKSHWIKLIRTLLSEGFLWFWLFNKVNFSVMWKNSKKAC